MHDIRAIRDNPAAFDAAMARRGLAAQSAAILAVDQARRMAIHTAEKMKAEMNIAAKQVGQAKSAGDEELFNALRNGLAKRKQLIAENETQAKDEDARLRDILMALPNIMFDDVPDGATEDENIEIHRWGSPKNFAFAPVEHYEIARKMAGGMSLAAGLLAQGGALSGMFFDNSASLSGSRFVILSGAIAKLHRVLAQFMMDLHTGQHKLREMWVPVLVRDEAMEGTGQLPKFANDSYKTTNGWWLIPTAEVPLTNLAAGGVFRAQDLPLRFVAHSQCFRSEAGSAGKDTAGMLRQHQFEKVEMVSITTPEQSGAEHKRMTECAQNVLQALELPYRTMVLCSGDTGFGARRTHDIEVWLPGQNTYREISSVSICGDFQARRMNARYRAVDGEKPQYVHTLNGSGLAVGRCLIAVLENGQQQDGSVDLPAALHPYLGGKTRITADGVIA